MCRFQFDARGGDSLGCVHGERQLQIAKAISMLVANSRMRMPVGFLAGGDAFCRISFVFCAKALLVASLQESGDKTC